MSFSCVICIRTKIIYLPRIQWPFPATLTISESRHIGCSKCFIIWNLDLTTHAQCSKFPNISNVPSFGEDWAKISVRMTRKFVKRSKCFRFVISSIPSKHLISARSFKFDPNSAQFQTKLSSTFIMAYLTSICFQKFLLLVSTDVS